MAGPLHSLFAVQSRRPAWALGARMATVVIVPLVVGLITDELGYGLIATLAALNVGITDPGGADRLRARALLAATIAEAFTLALGTLVGADWWVAVPVMFVVALAGGMAGAYGEVAGNVAFFSVLMFIIGVGLAGDAADALDRLWLVGLGGAWAMLLCLALWPLRPLRPAQLALGAAFESIAGYLDRFPALARGGLRPRTGATVLGAGQPRAKLAAARGTLELVEGTASGARPAARLLDELIADGDALLRRAEALGEQVARLSLEPAEALRGRTAAAIEAAAADARAVGAVLVRARRVPPNREALERALQELDAAIVDERARVAAGADDVRAIVAFRGVELTLRECAALVEEAAGLAERAATARRERAAVGRHARARPPARSPDRVAVLRAELRPDSMLLRHSLRFAVALAVGLAISALLDIQRGYWVDITIAVILRPYIVTTFERGVQRVVGTVLGGFVAAGLLAAVSGDVAVVAVLLALAFATFAVLPLNYGWAVLFLTPLVVLLVGFALGAGPEVAIDRIVDTLIGGAIAVAAAALLWPRSERGDFALALRRALALDRDYVSAVLAGRDAAAAGRRAATAADDLEARYRRLVGEPHRGRRGLGAVWEAVAANRRLYVATVALETQLGSLGPERVSGLDEIAAALRDAIDAIADGGSLAPDPLERALSGLRADVLELAERRTHELRASTELTPTAATLRRQALVLAQFDACGAALHRLRSAVRELSPSAA